MIVKANIILFKQNKATAKGWNSDLYSL